MIKLTDEEGSLAAGDILLLVRYPAGDCDRCPWPMTTEEEKHNLASALYDAREMGEIPDDMSVWLPDGEEFRIEDNLKEASNG